jgi:hypothetical protein
MRIVTLLARHGTETYSDAPDALLALFKRQMADVAHDLVIIDNTLPSEHHESLGHGRELIGSPGTSWEFSAWQRGLEHIEPRLARYDFVNLATSAFRALYTRYLDRFDAGLLDLVRGRNAAIGHIDYYNAPVSALGRTLRSWLRSSFVLLPPAELQLLKSPISVEEPRALFSGDAEAPFRADAPISAAYRQFIVDWLTGPGTGQGVEWHSRFALTTDRLALFEAKTVAILNEQLLSARLRAQGCALIDVTWLATRRSQLAPGEPLGVIPGWRHQLTHRDVDAAPAQLLNEGEPD